MSSCIVEISMPLILWILSGKTNCKYIIMGSMDVIKRFLLCKYMEKQLWSPLVKIILLDLVFTRNIDIAN